MMKRIISLMLALLTVVMLLASCGSDDDALEGITDDASRYTTTLNMWVIAGNALIAEAGQKVREGYVPEDVPADNLPADAVLTAKQQTVATWSPELREAFLQVYGVQEAVNKITKAKFKTQLNLVYVTEDQYYEKLEAAFVEHEKVLATDTTPSTNEEVVEEETVIIDGIPQLKYPEIEDYMVDVFFMNGFERYRQYVKNKWVSDKGLDTLLESSATEISKYVNKIFLDGVKSTGMTYAIPNYHVIGEYTYLMVDNALLNDYSYTPESFLTSSIYDENCKTFLKYIYEERQAGENIYPIYTNNIDPATNKVDLAFSPVHYWSYDLDSVAGACQVQGDEFALFGGMYSNTDAWGKKVSYDNLLANSNYMTNLATKKYYENTEGFVTTDPNAKAAVHVVNGGWELREEYIAKGYTPLIMQSPRATTETIFESMFAVGGYSEQPERAMEVITYLNTNANLRNTIQYGVQDVNYTLHKISEGEGQDYTEYTYIIPTEENVYEMDLLKTGNIFIAYPMFDVTDPEQVTIEDIKAKTLYLQNQNLEATTTPTMCVWFNTADGKYAWDEESIRVLNVVSARLGEYLNVLKTEADINGIYNSAKNLPSKAMATYILGLLSGSDLTYTYKGETKTVTAASLEAALNRMTDKQLAQDTGDDQNESPYAFYEDWFASATIAR